MRRGAAWALGQIKDARAVEPLLAALKDRDEDVRRAAAGALGEIGDKRAAGVLSAALRSGNLETVAGAYAYFIRLGEAGSEEPLIAALNEHGDERMAQDFLNCGNSRLGSAAREWVKESECVLTPRPAGASGPVWGGE
jgi:HEAT repeat protein